MEKILKFQQWLTPAPDKLAHFFWGFMYLVFLTYLNVNDLYTFIIIFALALSKEIIDKYVSIKEHALDILFTILPFLLKYFFL